MKNRFLIIFAIRMMFSSLPLIYVSPEPSPEDDFRYSDHVLTGKINTSKIITDPREDKSAMSFYDTVVYDVKVIDWHKNPLEKNIVTVYVVVLQVIDVFYI